jgi:Domain of unknown function (DUF4397)
MRLNRFIFLGLGMMGLYACGSDTTGVVTPPPNASVRYVNALADTGSVDIGMIDQTQWSANAKPLAFRAASAFQVTDATKPRHIRVFPTSTNPAVTSQIIDDETITFTPGTRVTLLLTGSARAQTAHFVTISDDITPPAAGQIAVRFVNASTGAVDAYLTDTTTTPLPGTPTFANVGSTQASAYVARPTGRVAAQSTDAGSATVTATRAGANAPPSQPGDVFPAAGVNSQYTKFSVYYFPRGVAGSPQTATTPGLVWFVDRNPCDAGITC